MIIYEISRGVQDISSTSTFHQCLSTMAVSINNAICNLLTMISPSQKKMKNGVANDGYLLNDKVYWTYPSTNHCAQKLMLSTKKEDKIKFTNAQTGTNPTQPRLPMCSPSGTLIGMNDMEASSPLTATFTQTPWSSLTRWWWAAIWSVHSSRSYTRAATKQHHVTPG